jgi:hypothetical protein
LQQVSHQNAMRWYNFDPFAHRSKADSTVGALRQEASGHDVSIRSFDQGRYERTTGGVSLADIAAKATA